MPVPEREALSERLAQYRVTAPIAPAPLRSGLPASRRHVGDESGAGQGAAGTPTVLPVNRRRHERVDVRLPASVSQHGGDALHGWTVDVSSGGLRLAMPGPAPVGAYIDVLVDVRGHAVSAWVRVVACTGDDDEWEWRLAAVEGSPDLGDITELAAAAVA